MKEQNTYCLIFAGGKGRRLWPCSREEYPKQFIDFFGVGRTQLQQTYDRFRKLLPDSHIFVSTGEPYVDIVRTQLPDIAEENILAEPVPRNTAPAAMWAAWRISLVDPEATIILTPSDQTVQDEEAFLRNMREGVEFIEGSTSQLVMGVRPTRPEPGYGYLQMGEMVEKDVYKVQTFAEKPEREFARMFLESGEFLWNTGLFISGAQQLLATCEVLVPAVTKERREAAKTYSPEEEKAFIKENFPLLPNMSLDYCLLEKTAGVAVMECDFGWADLGTWHSIYEARQKSADDNVLVDTEALMENSHGNVIKLPEGRMAIINGLDGFIVAEQGNVLLICKKEDSSALIRKYLNEMQIRKGDKFV